MNFKFDEERLVAIRNIFSKHGVKLTSSLVLITLLLGSSAKSSCCELKKVPKEGDHKIDSIAIERFAIKIAGNVDWIMKEEKITTYEKIEKILDMYQLTYEELDVCCAIACAEACGEGMNYEEASNVINTAYNRIISAKWVASLGDNLYDQMTAPNQFVVYQNGSYLRFLGRTDLPGYQAVIDFLSNTTELSPHCYLSFRSNGSNIDGVELVSGGNLYFNVLDEEDRLTDFRVSAQSLTLGKNYL